ncbi:DUF2065 domain-containing protein [Thiohalobacter sp.]|uniref:DUF2065 domain-containing protein n=1 Tax=Thiohalobacter sp. TaxID=2025948 RepID=UPI0026169054|nr:DUF2065 domain-containing protein [Thiohalobacter sp.]
MWNDLFVALALVLVIEGMLPFLSPQRMREAMLSIARMDDRILRITGLLSMLAGVGLLYLVH